MTSIRFSTIASHSQSKIQFHFTSFVSKIFLFSLEFHDCKIICLKGNRTETLGDLKMIFCAIIMHRCPYTDAQCSYHFSLRDQIRLCFWNWANKSNLQQVPRNENARTATPGLSLIVSLCGNIKLFEEMHAVIFLPHCCELVWKYKAIRGDACSNLLTALLWACVEI